MSEDNRNKFIGITKAVSTIAISAVVAACATPTTQAPQASRQSIDEAAQRQLLQRAQGRKQEGPDSPFLAFPMDQRLFNVASRVVIAAAPYCGNNLRTSYPISVGAIGNGPVAVMDTQSTLQPFDLVVTVNGRPIGQGPEGRRNFYIERNNTARSNAPLTVDAVRGNQRVSARLEPVQACNYNVELIDPNYRVKDQYNTDQYPGRVFNAYATGNKIYVSPVVMNKLRNDADVGFVMGHELAHNALSHTQAQMTNARIGAGLGVLADIVAATAGINTQGMVSKIGMMKGATIYSVEFEQEADYAGLYILARTGYDLNAAIRVPDRLALETNDPRSIKSDSTHPATAARAAAAMRTIDEIERKKAQGLPLYPTMKNKGPQ